MLMFMMCGEFTARSAYEAAMLLDLVSKLVP